MLDLRLLGVVMACGACGHDVAKAPPAPRTDEARAAAAPAIAGPKLIPFAHLHDGQDLFLRGPGYTALSLFTLGWFRIDEHGVRADPETTREIDRLRDAIGVRGRVLAGRTL